MNYDVVFTIIAGGLLIAYLIGIYREYLKDKKDSERHHHHHTTME